MRAMTSAPPSGRVPPGREAVEEGLRHIGYELEQACQCAALLRAGTHQNDDDPVVHNALLESMLLHARSLIEFFVRPAGRFDDMALNDFVATKPRWKRGPDDAVARLGTEHIKTLLDKHLAHLTWPRVGSNQPSWTYDDIPEDLWSVTNNWCEYLRRRDPDLRAVLAPHVFFARQALNGDDPMGGFSAITGSTN